MPPVDAETIRLAAFAVIGLLVLFGAKKLLSGRSGPGAIPGLEKMLREGRYNEAADLALKADRPGDAIEYYLRSQQPARAAHVAAKIGNARMAAELFERAGNFQSAALWFEKAQNPAKAEEMRRKIAPEAVRSAEPQATRPRASSAASVELEQKRKSRESAEAHMAAGNIKSAADSYRDAGMVEEAIHLYVNVLALPAEAAPLLKKRGNSERAAELYELAGMNNQAASLLAEVGLKAKAPEQLLDRISRLSREVALDYATQLVRARPLSVQTKDLHYAYAKLLEESGSRDRALETFTGIRKVAGSFKDVPQRIDALRAPPPPQAPPIAPRPRPQSGPAPLQGIGAPSLATAFPRSSDTPDPLSALPGLGTPMSRPSSRELRLPGQVVAIPTPPATPPVYVYRGVTDDEVALIAREAAAAAVKAAQRVDAGRLEATYFRDSKPAAAPPPAKPVPDTFLHSKSPERSSLARAGLDAAPLPPSLLDEEVQAARLGPTTESIRGAIGEAHATESNAELHYRLGLAYLAEGNWASALDAFEKVEATIPGYRSAHRRAEEIKRWRNALQPHLTTLGVEGAAERGPPARYLLRGELGRGGMAVVYRATDTVLGRDVALKFLSDALSAREDVRELFQREARAVAALNHPNIVTVYDFGTLEGRTFIAMEYVDGTTVRDLMADKISIAETLRILKQLLDALELAHSRKIIHRDIKPSNVMVTGSGFIKLMDFGLAKSIATGAEASMVAGTPAYMSPEQMVGEDVDHRTDIFAVGVMAYQMLTGMLPFQGMDRMRPPPRIRDLAPAVPEALEQLVITSLAFDRERRIQKAGEFSEPMRKLLSAVQEASFR
ncbi:MAG: protein kinase [Deltaproteobacteria bacterium]|nr:protein kinase [Deltaproteobacteria bacterium]